MDKTIELLGACWSQALEMRENRIEATRYLNMELLAEQKKEASRRNSVRA